MPDRRASAFAALSLCAVLLTALSLPAQADRWFRVELMVFSQSGGESAEQWDPTPVLSYPDEFRFLVDPRKVARVRQEHNADSELDEFGRQILTLQGEPGASIIPSRTVSGDTVSPATLPTPFVTLPAQQQEFRGKGAYMQRSGRYQILFHETWVQPVAEKNRSLPIVLDRSGDTGQWPELQGSIELYLSRYLHLETNLWLNTQGNYLPGSWRMPAPPLGPPSLIIEQSAQFEPDSPPADSAGAPAAEPASTGQNAGDAALLEPQQPEYAQSAEELQPIYPFRHAVPLRQKRRMRSNEVHYLDHPMLGLVVKVTPLGEEALETLARAEGAAAGTP